MVKRTIFVPKADIDRFRKLQPGYGSFTWFVRTALRRFNELHSVAAGDTLGMAVADIDFNDQDDEE